MIYDISDSFLWCCAVPSLLLRSRRACSISAAFFPNINRSLASKTLSADCRPARVIVAAPLSRAGLECVGVRHLLSSEGLKGSKTESCWVEFNFESCKDNDIFLLKPVTFSCLDLGFYEDLSIFSLYLLTDTHRQPAVIRLGITASFHCWHGLPVWWFPACSCSSLHAAYASRGGLGGTDATNRRLLLCLRDCGSYLPGTFLKIDTFPWQ